MPTIYKEGLDRKYYARPCSCAFLFFILSILFVLIFPIWIVSLTGRKKIKHHDIAIWIGDNTYFDQPIIQYENASIVVFSGIMGDNVKQYVWSTNTDYNSNLGNLDKASSLSVTYIDYNKDSVPEGIQFIYNTKLEENFQPMSVSIYPTMTLLLRNRVKYFTLGVPVTTWSSSLPSLSITGICDLKINQKDALPSWGKNKYKVDYNTIFKTYEIEDIYNYLDKEVVLTTNNHHSYFKHLPKKSFKLENGILEFNANITYNINNMQIQFVPTLLEIIKYGLIQYLIFVLVFFAIIKKISGFLYKSQIFATSIEEPEIIKSKID